MIRDIIEHENHLYYVEICSGKVTVQKKGKRLVGEDLETLNVLSIPIDLWMKIADLVKVMQQKLDYDPQYQ